jgi:hypothetical protein
LNENDVCLGIVNTSMIMIKMREAQFNLGKLAAKYEPVTKESLTKIKKKDFVESKLEGVN